MGRRRRLKEGQQNVHVSSYVLTADDIKVASKYTVQYKSVEGHEKLAVLGDAAEDIIAGIESVTQLTEDERDDVISAVHNFVLSECPGTVKDAMGMWFRDWNLKSVVEFKKQHEIQAGIAELVGRGVKGNEKSSFICYQTVISAIMKDLSNKEREKFSLQAAKWNHLRAPAVVKSQVAEKCGHKMMVSYANRCWEKLGIEVVILYGFRTPGGQVEAYV
ncbi:hypothetical protein JAAARDRAFT_188473 [Jaapia argillacea MUCL 33604]|uniref:Uncharacterized protein n=1 Tax=Jaapia argillacea MUCL 33604 TaxID=933084 RepID=A0A067QDU0_9AGAM|nr:hypothetical protein JAAARDRAFT_188473 [Jaapia argillacea MUCL 33604]